LHQTASKTGINPLSFLELQEVFGKLIDNERFTKRYLELIQLIYEEKGIRKIMNEI